MSKNTESDRDDVGSYHCNSNDEKSNCSKKNAEVYIKPTVIMVMRHSERVDDCCGNWVEQCNKIGRYEQFDLNMPSRLPINRPFSDFTRDTMITRSGVVLAQMVGRSLQVSGNAPDVIYCSPSLRCIQTAAWVRELSGSSALLRVEPGVFEDFSYPNGIPTFLTPLQRHAFPVDKSYRPVYSIEKVTSKQESNFDYNERVRTTLEAISQQYEAVIGRTEMKVLVVAHASTVDMAVGLLRERPRHTNEQELRYIAFPVPYCALAYLKKRKGGWIPDAHAVPPITYEDLTTRYNPHYIHRM